jgi:RNA polymerase sigma-70 factor (ECF subfamily)
MTEQELLAAARDGSDDAFARLISPYRAGLSAHCYRLLGSVHDAEDALQEAMLRAWRGLAGFQGRSSLRSWLYTIATNACLRAIERRHKRVLPIDYGPATADPHAKPGAPIVESVWIEPYPDPSPAFAEELASPEARYEQRESVELAFVAALQHLPARQRAVLILRDVLGFSGAEVADALAMTPDAVYSALQRAHKTVDECLPERTQQATLRSLGDDGLSKIVGGFVDAWERADVEALAARLAEDAAFTMPPDPTWFRGRDTIAAFLGDFPLSGTTRWRVIPTRANAQPAFGMYAWSGETGAFLPSELAVLTLESDRIAEITVFRDPPRLVRFGLPERIEP